MLKFIKQIILDALNTQWSWSKQREGFAFIVHPRNYHDVTNNVKFLRYLPKKFVMKFFPKILPFTVSKISGLRSVNSGKELPGWVIGVPIFARELVENRAHAQAKINQAITLAQNKGAAVVGLGGLTGSVTAGGAGLKAVGGTRITAGRAYTAYTVKAYADDVMKRLGAEKPNVTLAIVGAAGGVGTALSRLMITEPYKKIILVDLERKIEKISGVLAEEKKQHVEVTHQVGQIKDANIVITVTNAPEAVVQASDLKIGAVVIDDAQPSDIDPEILKDRPDVLVIEAGAIKLPDGVRVGTNMRLANRDDTYCCLGEVMALAASGQEVNNYAPDAITPEVIKQIAKMGQQIGLTITDYQFFGKPVDLNKLTLIKQLWKEHGIL
jgi:predicted amino acid dehydrogenase